MKKNMIYVATGIVFLIFAICIAYVFTEPSQSPQKQEARLEEQDASQLTAQNAEESKTPSTDALVFTAQDNSQTITVPPAENGEQKETNLAAAPENLAAQSMENMEKAEKTGSTQAQNTAVSNNNTISPAAATPEKSAEPKPVLQDKLPVPFVADSLKTRTILEPKKNTNTIVYAELMMDGNQVGLVIEGDKPIKPKTFRLNNPDRVVVDIEGYWALKIPQLISNRMVKDIRSNAQKDKTRIVFDLKLPVTSSLLYRIHSRKYQLVFK